MHGQQEVDWVKFKEACVDCHGFDKRNLEANGEHIIRVILPCGSILIRYGSEIGHYTAPKGTDYDKLALPYKQETIEYNEYQVTHSEGINVCEVYKGRVVPAFDSEGGAIQYYHPITIRESVRKGI